MTTWFAERPVGEIRPGDHAWLAYADREEQDRVIGDFVYDGLSTSEKVVYVTDSRPWELPGMLGRYGIDPTPFAEVGQLRLLPRQHACLTMGRFDPDRLLRTLSQEIDSSFDEGYRAVRVTADLSWALREPDGTRRVLSCESGFEETVSRGTTAMAICQVERAQCAPDELQVLQNTHEVLVEVNPEFDDSVLKITRTFAPYGLRLEGELDGVRQQPFIDALAMLSSVQAWRGRIHLDLRRLDFIDLGSLNLLGGFALRMPSGHSLVLDNLRPDVAAVIDLMGWHLLPGVSRGTSGGLT
jgi:anti-anti-sigma regulatory factor